jgi:hypothetical protein
VSKRDQAIRQWRRILASKEPRRDIQRGVMGDGNGNIRVTGRSDYVYVRVKAKGTALWQCINHKVSDVENLPVLIEKMPTGNDWQVIDVDIPMLANAGDGWDGGSYLQNHAGSHEWPDYFPGNDPVNVYQRSLVPLRTQAKNTSELKVRVAPLRYTYAGELKTFYGGELYVGSYQPASGQARNVLTYLDPRDNTLYGHPAKATTYSATVPLDLPSVPPYCIPSAVVRVTGDRNFVSEVDILDYRLVLDAVEPDNIADLADVQVSGVSDNDVIAWDSASSLWINQAQTGSGAPSDSPYIVTSYDASLTAERVIAPGAGLKGTDAGAGAEYKIELDIEELPTAAIADDDWLITYDKSEDVPSKIAWSSLTTSSWKFSGTVIVVGDSAGADAATLSDAVSLASAGDVILIEAGTHTVNNVTIPEDVHVWGMGQGITILDATSGGTVLTLSSNHV